MTVVLEPSGASLTRWGLRSWLFLGVVLAVGAAAWLLSQFSGVVVPLVLAAVLGALFAPVVEWLAERGVPRSAAAGLVLLGLAGVVVLSVWLVVAGVLDQAPQISQQLDAGLASIQEWLATHGISLPGGAAGQAEGGVHLAVQGLAGALPGVVSGVASLLIGVVVAVFLLYYVLVDWAGLSATVGAHLGVEPPTGVLVVADAVDALRRYFWSLTLSAVVTAVLIGGAAWALGVPLPLTIAVITLTTSYVPYLGAIFSGAFATVIALGASGPRTAVVLLVVVLVVQNVVQTVVLARLSSAALRLHPIVTMASTIAGAAVAGVLGATLGTPAVAAAVLVRRRLRAPAAAGPTDPVPTGP
jgi:predicted PurR-regulated permease PerM